MKEVDSMQGGLTYDMGSDSTLLSDGSLFKLSAGTC